MAIVKARWAGRHLLVMRLSRLWSCVQAAAGTSLVGVVGGVGARVPSLISVLEPRAGRGD
jgi:hypothetical protein